MQIGQIKNLSLGLYVRMFFGEKPTHMRKKEASGGVVRIRVRLRKFVMNPMISGPVVGGILEGYRIENDQDEAQRPLGLVGSVRPESVGTASNPKHSAYVEASRFRIYY